MASLALIVSVIFFSVILIGLASLIMSRIYWIPNIIVYALSIISILLGLWWLLLPISVIKYTGLIPVFCGYYAINYRKNKKASDNLKNEKG